MLTQCEVFLSLLFKYVYCVLSTHLLWLSASCDPNISLVDQFSCLLSCLISALYKNHDDSFTSPICVTYFLVDRFLVYFLYLFHANNTVCLRLRFTHGCSPTSSSLHLTILLVLIPWYKLEDNNSTTFILDSPATQLISIIHRFVTVLDEVGQANANLYTSAKHFILLIITANYFVESQQSFSQNTQ